jgi:hypothetical protein
MFVARNTGRSPSQQPFVSCNRICSARVVDTIEKNVRRFVGVAFVHDHDIGVMTVAGARVLENETLKKSVTCLNLD